MLKDALEPDIPYVFGAVLSNFNYEHESDPASLTCSGKGMTLEEAKVSALGEAVERYCSEQYDEKELIIAKYRQLTDAINPVDLVLYSSEQYSSGILPYAEFRDDTDMRWVRGYSLVENIPRLVPAIAVYLNYSPLSKGEYLFPPTSNGLAAGSCSEHALLKGLLEVVERDAFLVTWLCKLPMPQVDLSQIQDKRIRSLIHMYDRRGVKIHVNALVLDTKIPTFLATAIDTSGRGPAAAVGLSAHLNPSTGILGAIQEIGQIRPHLTREMRKPDFPKRLTNLKDFRNVKTIQDHECLYTAPEMTRAFDFLLLNGRSIDPSELPHGPDGDTHEELAWCINQLTGLGVDVVAINLTTSDIAALGLSVARVIVTEFQPMHFGFNERRLGGRRLFELPEKIGLSVRRFTSKDLNSYPHPLG